MHDHPGTDLHEMAAGYTRDVDEPMAESLAQGAALTALTDLAVSDGEQSAARRREIARATIGGNATEGEIDTLAAEVQSQLGAFLTLAWRKAIELAATDTDGAVSSLLRSYKVQPDERPEIALRAACMLAAPSWSVDGMLWLDAVGVASLARLGGEGERAARAVRDKARRRWDERIGRQQLAPYVRAFSAWELWFAPDGRATSVPFAEVLARVLWCEVVKPQIEQENHTPTALSLPFVEALTKPMRPGVSYDDGRLVDREGVVITDLSHEITEVPAVDLEVLEKLTTFGAKMLFSVSGYRLVWWLAETARRQKVIERTPEPWVVEVAGGWRELAKLILVDATGSTTLNKKIPGELKAIAIALARGWFPLPDGTVGNLLTLRYGGAHRGQRGKVRFELASCWLPYDVRSLPRRTQRQRRARVLSPVLPPPPPTANYRTHAAQAALAWDLVGEMTRQRREVVRHGGLVLNRDTRLALERRAGLTSEQTADRVWFHWQEVGFTKEPEPGLVQLGERHPDAWRLIVKGGQASNAAARGEHERAKRKHAKGRK